MARGRVQTLADVAAAGGVGHGKGQGVAWAVVAVDDDVWWSSVLEEWKQTSGMITYVGSHL